MQIKEDKTKQIFKRNNSHVFFLLFHFNSFSEFLFFPHSESVSHLYRNRYKQIKMLDFLDILLKKIYFWINSYL